MAHKSSSIIIFSTAYKPFIGGSEIAIEEIAKRLPEIYFDIATPRVKRQLKPVEHFSNGSIHRLGLGTSFDKILMPLLGFVFALRKRPAVIHGYQASHASGAAGLYKLFFPRAKFILTIQEGKDLSKQSILIKFFRNILVRRADVVTVISKYLQNYISEISPRSQIVLIPNGVDLEKFKAKSEKRKEEDKNSKVIITVSRLVPKNGIADLIDAFQILNTKYAIRDTRLVIIGDGPLEKILKLKAKSLKLERVEFLGSVPYDRIPEYLANADVFVRPSISEGLGSAFLEAMAAGIPIIGTPVGGIPDFLKDRETGLFCKVNDPEDLAQKIKELMDDQELRKNITESAWSLIKDRYDWNIVAKQINKLYVQ